MRTKFLIGLTMIFAVFSCKDSFDEFNPDKPIIPDPPIEITFEASAFVEVMDAFGMPVEGAVIALGSKQQTTDEYGLVHFDDVTMSTFTYLTVEKSGFFHGSRRFYPVKDKTEHLRIILLDDNSIGEFDAGKGGVVEANGSVILDFPQDAIVTANGELYSGFVAVSAQPIPANDPELSSKMPGDLVGVTEEGKTGVLGSMGMVAVELRSLSGDLLQVKDGSKVKMTMQVPPEMQGKAPATIPMWYFDEATGLWQEEGTATLSGGQYTADVGHFTYWNYDAWFPIVPWTASFVYESGPAANISVCLTILALDTKKCASTNDEGVVSGMVAADELMLMEVLDPCGNVVYSEEIGPYSDSTTIGPITIPESAVNLTTITGTAVDCDGNPVTNGFVRVEAGHSNSYVELDESDGTFDIIVMNCAEDDVVLIVIDEGALRQSLPQTYDYATTIDAGEITVCETITELIAIDIEGEDDAFLYFFPSAAIEAGITYVNAQDSTTGGSLFFSFNGIVPGTYEVEELGMWFQLSGGDVVQATQATVVITYYGDVGDYIQGTISGVVSTNPQGGGQEYNFTGTISILQE